jgi:hypothetical protein
VAPGRWNTFDYWSNAVAVISVPMLRDLLGNT